MNEKKAKPLKESRLITRHTVNEQQKDKLNILLAEDNPVNTKVAITLLEKVGHSVEHAENGQQAIEKMKRHDYHIVFMDVQMPTMDGLEATRRIRLWEAGKEHTPIIAMTAHALNGDRQRCLEAGMDDYVAKPIRAMQLFEAIEGVVGGKDGRPARASEHGAARVVAFSDHATRCA